MQRQEEPMVGLASPLLSVTSTGAACMAAPREAVHNTATRMPSSMVLAQRGLNFW